MSEEKNMDLDNLLKHPEIILKHQSKPNPFTGITREEQLFLNLMHMKFIERLEEKTPGEGG